jgi:16S rRNA (uracil1498-N3)-methyltransferase
MPAERFFHPDLFQINRLVSLKDEELHHLAHVMRIKPGEKIELINGKGQLAIALVEKIERQQAICHIVEIESSVPPTYDLILAIAYPRLPRLEYAMEKAVELGVTEFWLFPGELSEKKELSPSQFQRLSHILISSVKQCGRLYLPKICLKPPLYAWEALSQGTCAFFGDTRKEAPDFLPIVSAGPCSSIFFAIGPEKGFHPREESALENKLSMQGVRLHENILRVDTAVISAACMAFAFLQKC